MAFLFLSVLLDLLYTSHEAIISIIGFNPTLNQTLINISQFLTIPFLLIFASRIARKSAGLLLFFICTVLSLTTSFIEVPSNCEWCEESILQMTLVVIVRFMISFEFSMYFISQAEFYPVSVRSVGIGAGGILGALCAGLSQVLMINTGEMGINPFLIISVMSLLSFLVFFWIPETLSMKSRDQIPEVQEILEN